MRQRRSCCRQQWSECAAMTPLEISSIHLAQLESRTNLHRGCLRSHCCVHSLNSGCIGSVLNSASNPDHRISRSSSSKCCSAQRCIGIEKRVRYSPRGYSDYHRGNRRAGRNIHCHLTSRRARRFIQDQDALELIGCVSYQVRRGKSGDTRCGCICRGLL